MSLPSSDQMLAAANMAATQLGPETLRNPQPRPDTGEVTVELEFDGAFVEVILATNTDEDRVSARIRNLDAVVAPRAGVDRIDAAMFVNAAPLLTRVCAGPNEDDELELMAVARHELDLTQVLVAFCSDLHKALSIYQAYDGPIIETSKPDA